MARPSYAAELDKYVNEQLARAQAQAEQQKSEAYAQAAREEEQADEQAAPLPSKAQSDDADTALPYAPPRAPMPSAAPRQAPPPQAPAPGGYAGGYSSAPSAPASVPARSPGASAPTAVATAQRTPTLNVAALDEEITRLQQMRVWLSDPLMCAVIDKFIGQRMGATERRQVYYTVAAATFSLVIGWLLSAISPASVLIGLFHR